MRMLPTPLMQTSGGVEDVCDVCKEMTMITCTIRVDKREFASQRVAWSQTATDYHHIEQSYNHHCQRR